jgi:hypothetical protein
MRIIAASSPSCGLDLNRGPRILFTVAPDETCLWFKLRFRARRVSPP